MNYGSRLYAKYKFCDQGLGTPILFWEKVFSDKQGGFLGGWRPFIYIQNSPSYRTWKIIKIYVVANLWRRLAAITLSGGKARHSIYIFLQLTFFIFCFNTYKLCWGSTQ